MSHIISRVPFRRRRRVLTVSHPSLVFVRKLLSRSGSICCPDFVRIFCPVSVCLSGYCFVSIFQLSGFCPDFKKTLSWPETEISDIRLSCPPRASSSMIRVENKEIQTIFVGCRRFSFHLITTKYKLRRLKLD